MSDEATQSQPRSTQSAAARHTACDCGPASFWWPLVARASVGVDGRICARFFVGLLIVPLVVLVGIVLWWLFASRLRWSDRLLVVGTLAAVTAGTMFAADTSFRGIALVVYALPIAVSAWLGWLVLSCLFPWPIRRAGLLLVFIAVGMGCSLLRMTAWMGSFVAKFDWRWTPTPEQKLLAELKSKPAQQSDVQRPRRKAMPI